MNSSHFIPLFKVRLQVNVPLSVALPSHSVAPVICSWQEKEIYSPCGILCGAEINTSPPDRLQ